MEALAISPDGQLMAGGGAGRIELYSPATGSLVRTIPLRPVAAKKGTRRESELPLTTNDETVAALAFSSDGSQILGLMKGVAQVWSAATGQFLRRIDTGTEQYSMATFSSAGRRLLVLRQGEVDVWDITQGKRVGSWPAAYGVMSPDGRRLALIDAASLQPGAPPTNLKSRIGDLESVNELAVVNAIVGCFTPDGRRVVATRDTPPLIDSADPAQAMPPMRHFLRDLESGDETPLSSMNFVSLSLPGFAPDGKQLAIAQGNSIALVSLTGKPTRILYPSGPLVEEPGVASVSTETQSGGILGALAGIHSAFSPDGRWFATRTVQGIVDFFDLSTGGRSSLRAGTKFGFGPLSFARNGRYLAFFDTDGARLFEVATGKLNGPFRDVPAQGADITDTYVVGYGGTGTLGIWDLETGSMNPIVDYSQEALSKLNSKEMLAVANLSIQPPIAPSPDGRRFAAMQAAAGPPANRRKGLLGRLADAVPGLPGEIARGTARPSEPGGPKLELGIYDAKTKARVLTLDSHRGASAPIGSSIVFSPDGRYLAAGGVFESTEPDQVQKFNPLRGWRTKTERTPPVQIWDAQTGRPLPPLEGDNGGVTVLAFSPRGDMLATAADPLQDKAKQPDSVTIWDVATGRARYRLSGNSDRIHSLSFSRKSLLLAVSGGDGVTRFWQMDSGELAGSLTSFAGGEWLVLTPSGFFDGSPGAWSRVSWRGSEDLADVGPVEQYFSEFYRPGVLAEVMAGRRPEGARTISAIDRRQPLVKITAPATAESRSVPVRLEITDAGTGARCAPSGMVCLSKPGAASRN